ncbi:D-serine ammonia-lyase [Clostridium sp. D2Q-11]|uniref:Probable D-serine dehydratase n=1 Tax=Anaeromonas frigoriresistens TaxID=2683708 RepID=A0A942Z995_9FIRM|nr:D-serine ammonia-lyase [Anaeromonas frigoriresistens]MBS4539093.1 D-serine ammonia-lyase [Anaeromonas frigoriresistens]
MDEYNRNTLEKIKALKPLFWGNPNKLMFENMATKLDIKYSQILEAEDRLNRFAPLIKRLFPETEDGIIESKLIKADDLIKSLEQSYTIDINGDLYLKCDNYLDIAGSIKARGGIYEVLKITEDILLDNNLISLDGDYSKITEGSYRDIFSQHTIIVGSTGNLGMSIGIMSTALGFNAEIHMSKDAKEWKKSLLRSKGAIVIEHKDDYSKAVEEGRKKALADKKAFFIDDENSIDLFLGYSVAALRVEKQLIDMGVIVDRENPLHVYLPCGVGGAPGGIALGLKYVFKDNVYCYFVEPTHAPCMLLSLVTGDHEKVKISDYSIDNVTEADGLAVGSPSGLVSRIADFLIDGIYTIEDEELFKLLSILKDSEDIKAEPSAVSSLKGPIINNKKGSHIMWLTGGLFIPDDIYNEMYNRGK